MIDSMSLIKADSIGRAAMSARRAKADVTAITGSSTDPGRSAWKVDRNIRTPIIWVELGGSRLTSNNVTRVDLYEAVYQKGGLSRSQSSALVELVLKEITETLAKGETVKLSSFGSFLVRKKKQRVGRNPKTGTEATISPRRVVVFKPSLILKQRIN